MVRDPTGQSSFSPSCHFKIISHLFAQDNINVNQHNGKQLEPPEVQLKASVYKSSTVPKH